MTAREELDVEVKRRVMNMSRAELIHTLQICQVTNIETDDPLCRLHHRKLCDPTHQILTIRRPHSPALKP